VHYYILCVLRREKQKIGRVCEAKTTCNICDVTRITICGSPTITNIYCTLNHRSTFATYTTTKTLRPSQSPCTLAISHSSHLVIILTTSQILKYIEYRKKLWNSQEIAILRYSEHRILHLNMCRKPHHKFLQKFPVLDVSQVAMCVSLQSSKRDPGEGSFAKGFAMSSDLSRPLLSHIKSRWHWGSTCGSAKENSTKFLKGLLPEL